VTRDEARAELVALCGEDDGWLDRWLTKPQPFLGGETAAKALETEEGRERVVTRIGQLVHGVYV
jgi:uncharacterized protein (DUF2384 family)